jgi:hypothetical protein
MRFEKPKKSSGRPDFVSGRIAELERSLLTETNEIRKSELQEELSDWRRTSSQRRGKDDRGRRG